MQGVVVVVVEIIVVAVGVVGGPFGGSAVAAGYVDGVAWGVGNRFRDWLEW